jgi:hypothetical protein
MTSMSFNPDPRVDAPHQLGIEDLRKLSTEHARLTGNGDFELSVQEQTFNFVRVVSLR